MSRKANIINFVVSMAVTMGALLALIAICNERYSEEMVMAVIKITVGAIVAGFVNTLAHELGHYFVGKKNGFDFSSITIWFFRWEKVKNKTQSGCLCFLFSELIRSIILSIV